MKGLFDLGGWLRTEMGYMPEGSHRPSTNVAWSRVTSLIG